MGTFLLCKVLMLLSGLNFAKYVCQGGNGRDHQGASKQRFVPVLPTGFVSVEGGSERERSSVQRLPGEAPSSWPRLRLSGVQLAVRGRDSRDQTQAPPELLGGEARGEDPHSREDLGVREQPQVSCPGVFPPVRGAQSAEHSGIG